MSTPIPDISMECDYWMVEITHDMLPGRPTVRQKTTFCGFPKESWGTTPPEYCSPFVGHCPRFYETDGQCHECGSCDEMYTDEVVVICDHCGAYKRV